MQSKLLKNLIQDNKEKVIGKECFKKSIQDKKEKSSEEPVDSTLGLYIYPGGLQTLYLSRFQVNLKLIR